MAIKPRLYDLTVTNLPDSTFVGWHDLTLHEAERMRAGHPKCNSPDHVWTLTWEEIRWEYDGLAWIVKEKELIHDCE